MNEEPIELKPLPDSFSKWGYDWNVLKRTEDWALLSQSKDGAANYNVCKIKKAKAYTFPNGITIPPQEAIPSAEEWGRVAWNFCKLENAEKKYEELTNES